MLAWKDENKQKEARNGPFFEKKLLIIGLELCHFNYTFEKDLLLTQKCGKERKMQNKIIKNGLAGT